MAEHRSYRVRYVDDAPRVAGDHKQKSVGGLKDQMFKFLICQERRFVCAVARGVTRSYKVRVNFARIYRTVICFDICRGSVNTIKTPNTYYKAAFLLKVFSISFYLVNFSCGPQPFEGWSACRVSLLARYTSAPYRTTR